MLTCFHRVIQDVIRGSSSFSDCYLQHIKRGANRVVYALAKEALNP